MSRAAILDGDNGCESRKNRQTERSPFKIFSIPGYASCWDQAGLDTNFNWKIVTALESWWQISQDLDIIEGNFGGWKKALEAFPPFLKSQAWSWIIHEGSGLFIYSEFFFKSLNLNSNKNSIFENKL